MSLMFVGTIEAMLVVCRLMFCHGFTPDRISLLLIALIPKRKEGDRHIGIFSSIIRIFSELVRKSYSYLWWSRHRCFSGFGRSSLACAWKQSALCEYAVHTQKAVVAVLIDVVQAYGNINQ